MGVTTGVGAGVGVAAGPEETDGSGVRATLGSTVGVGLAALPSSASGPLKMRASSTTTIPARARTRPMSQGTACSAVVGRLRSPSSRRSHPSSDPEKEVVGGEASVAGASPGAGSFSGAGSSSVPGSTASGAPSKAAPSKAVS